MTNYEFYKSATNQTKWKPQPIHFTIRFILRLVIAFLLVWAFLCGMALIAPVHADTLPQHEKLLSYVGLQIDDDSITCLIFVDQYGKLERFAWYDELSGYKKYIGCVAVYDYQNDMIAVWDKSGDLFYSDWD